MEVSILVVVKHRIYQKHGEGEKDYKIVHTETSSDIVLRPGTTTNIEDAVAALERKVDIIISRFDKEGVLKPEHGGSVASKYQLVEQPDE